MGITVLFALRSFAFVLAFMFCRASVADSVGISGFLTTHCVSCHDGAEAEAGLDLDSIGFDLNDPKTFSLWTRIVDRVSQGEMPPESEEPPAVEIREGFVDALERGLTKFNRKQQNEQGRTTIRRLNRKEYERSVQSLLGITTPLAHLLPEETTSHGFDTVSDALRFSALHIDHYLDAANVAIEEAIELGPEPEWVNQRFPYTEQKGVLKNLKEDKVVIRLLDNAAVFFSEVSYISKVHGLNIGQSGMYRIRARGWAVQSDRPVVMQLHSGNYKSGTVRMLGFFDMLPDEAAEVEVITRLGAGDYLYPQGTDLREPANGTDNVWNVGGGKYQGSGLAVQWVEVEGPLESTWPPQRTIDLFGDVPLEKLAHVQWQRGKHVGYQAKPSDPKSSLKSIIHRFAVRAFRRPESEVDSQRFVRMAMKAQESGRSFEDACRIGLRAILCSPQFLILREEPGRLDDFALASRLSYFLWGSPPDQELLDLASSGKLHDLDVLRQQTERFLSDPRISMFYRDFVDQWMDLQRIDATSPDKKLYPEFDDILKESMLQESYRFFQTLVEEDLPVSNLVDSDFAMLNRRLAEHYGIEDVQGQEIQRVKLKDDSLRGGVLAQASVLKVTANGTVSSPVTRGAWVLSRILNQPPSPPPSAVGSIEPDTRGATTIREQLALHRRDPSCASCHRQMDPPGFAMECFDVIGGFRDRYRSTGDGDRVETNLRGRNIWEYKYGLPVDASGEMADGTKFNDFAEFRSILLGHPDLVANSLASHLMVYATGEKIEFADRVQMQQIVEQCESNQYGARSLIHAIIQSDIFRSK